MILDKVPYGEPNEEEQQALEKLKESISDGGLPYTDLTDAALLLFLRSRSLDVSKALTLIGNCDDFHKKYLLDRRLKVDDCLAAGIERPKLHSLRSVDKKGRPIYVLKALEHEPLLPMVDQLRLLWYFLENEALSVQAQKNGVTLILDMHEVSWGWYRKNVDAKGTWVSNLVSLLQNFLKCLPVKIERVYIMRMNMMFPTLWKVVAPFLDKEFIELVKFAKKIEDMDEIEVESLPDCVGGSVRYDHDLWLAARRQEEEAAAMKRTPSCHDWLAETQTEDRVGELSMATVAV